MRLRLSILLSALIFPLLANAQNPRCEAMNLTIGDTAMGNVPFSIDRTGREPVIRVAGRQYAFRQNGRCFVPHPAAPGTVCDSGPRNVVHQVGANGRPVASIETMRGGAVTVIRPLKLDGSPDMNGGSYSIYHRTDGESGGLNFVLFGNDRAGNRVGEVVAQVSRAPIERALSNSQLGVTDLNGRNATMFGCWSSWVSGLAPSRSAFRPGPNSRARSAQ